MKEYSTLSGGDNMTDVAGHQINENSKKTYAVYELSFGQPYNFYNEEENKFIWADAKKATLYTKEEAEAKAKELLKPRIEYYQSTGENYKEIHVGDLYNKNILRVTNELFEVQLKNISIGDTFKLAGDLGKFTKNEEVEVVSVSPFGNDIKLVLSNGKDKDDFYLDKN
jgi:Lhr-like helicase